MRHFNRGCGKALGIVRRSCIISLPFACALFVTPLLAQSAPESDVSKVKEFRPGILLGYMPDGVVINSAILLPPPPSDGSAAMAADEAARKASHALRGSARWKLAARDAPYATPSVVETFSCALGVKIGPTTTPHLNILLRRTLTDTGFATYKAKNLYSRKRPYVAANDATCQPQEEERLRNDGSYPSGHAAFGWGWALILSQVAPEKADVLMKRGLDFGEQRVICGYHWQSDVNAGRLVGAATFAQLQSNAEYLAQLAEAKREYQAAQAAGAAPSCDLELQAAAK